MSKSTQAKSEVKTYASQFEELLFSKEEEMTPEKVARRKKKVTRGFDSAIDGLEEQIETLSEEITAISTTIAKDDVKVITTLLAKRVELNGLKDLLAEAETAKAEFFAKK